MCERVSERQQAIEGRKETATLKCHHKFGVCFFPAGFVFDVAFHFGPSPIAISPPLPHFLPVRFVLFVYLFHHIERSIIAHYVPHSNCIALLAAI